MEMYSPAEEQFNRRRRTIGLALAPVILLALLLIPMPVAPAAHRLAAILSMMVVLWVTEALPLAVTALIGPVLVIVMRVAPARDTEQRRARQQQATSHRADALSRRAPRAPGRCRDQRKRNLQNG